MELAPDDLRRQPESGLHIESGLWVLETLQGQTAPTQLQYSQTVLLNFNTLSWPHITVGTLRKS